MKDGVMARYTLEFKQEAVRLVHGGDKPSHWNAGEVLSEAA
jgi:transposase-like protein